MKVEKLHKMQEESRKRHTWPFHSWGVVVPQEPKKTFMLDLMVPEIQLPCTSIKNPEVMKSIHDAPYLPSPVQEKRKRTYTHFTALAPDPPKKEKESRPPAVYSNVKSPYGIYDELKQEWGKKGG